MDLLLKGLGVLIIFASILFISVVFTKLLASKTRQSMSGKYVNVVETIALGLDKQLHLLKVGEEFVLIACAGKSVTFLTTLQMDNYSEDTQSKQGKNIFDFKNIFDKYIQVYTGKKKNKAEAKNSAAANITNDDIIEQTEGDMFKRNLERLKAITTASNKQGKNNGDDITNEK